MLSVVVRLLSGLSLQLLPGATQADAIPIRPESEPVNQGGILTCTLLVYNNYYTLISRPAATVMSYLGFDLL